MPGGLKFQYVLVQKPKSDAQQIDDLMKQYSEELSLGEHVGGSKRTPTETDIEQRLSNLKYDRTIPQSGRIVSVSLDGIFPLWLDFSLVYVTH